MQEIKTLDYIGQQIQKFNVTDAAIAELHKNYMELKIKGIDDKEGYKAVKAARLDIKSRRVSVEKMRKELTTDALLVQRKVNEEAKRITAKLEAIEDHCEKQESWIDQEKERIRIEQEEREKLKIKERYQLLLKHGMKFDGFTFKGGYVHEQDGVGLYSFFEESIEADSVKNLSDEEFGVYLGKISESHYLTIDYEQKEMQKEREKQRILDEDRLKKETEILLEKESLQALADQQAKELADIKKVEASKVIAKTLIESRIIPPNNFGVNITDAPIIPIEDINREIIRSKLSNELDNGLVRGKYSITFMSDYMDKVELLHEPLHLGLISILEKEYAIKN